MVRKSNFTLKYLAAGILLIIAFKLFREKVGGLEQQHGHIHENQPEIEHEHEHEHPGQGQHTHWHKHAIGIALSLWGLTSFAFILGFAHQEELALLALVAGGVNAWILMLSYGVSVLLGLMVVTIVSVKIYKQVQSKLMHYERYIPKIGAGILLIYDGRAVKLRVDTVRMSGGRETRERLWSIGIV